MNVPILRSNRQAAFYSSGQEAVDSLKAEVHDLTAATNRYRDQNLTSAAITTVAGVATAAGGALTFLESTKSLGMGIAAVAGMAFLGGIALCSRTNKRYQASEAERLAVAGELFDVRKGVDREKMRQLFQGQ